MTKELNFERKIASEADLQKVYACYKEICDHQAFEQYTPLWELDLYPTSDDMLGYIKKSGMLVAQESGSKNLAAVMALLDEKDHTSIHLFGLLPEYRGSGLATTMMYDAEKWARERGHDYMLLDVIRNNLPARKLYEKLGYRFIKDFDDYAEKDELLHFSLYQKPLV